MRHPVLHLGLAPPLVAPLAGPDAPAAVAGRRLAVILTGPLTGPDAPTALAFRRLAPIVTPDPLAVITFGGWVVAIAALVAALVLWRGHDRRLALVAEAAHELRGPLFAARLGLHALESAGEPVAGRAAAVELELRRAGLALEDLQAAPRGRRTGERLEVLDVGALVTGVATGWSTIARSHGARLRIERAGGPALVRADRLRLAQALGNLVANAAEHGGGEVLVRVAAERGRVRVEVADDGPGLPAPIAGLVAARRGRHSPRGHGLAIAQRIAERHGGRLLTAPAVRGARLVLDLPLARPAPQAHPPAPRFGRRHRSAAAGPTTPPAVTDLTAPPAATGGAPTPPAATDPTTSPAATEPVTTEPTTPGVATSAATAAHADAPPNAGSSPRR